MTTTHWKHLKTPQKLLENSQFTGKDHKSCKKELTPLLNTRNRSENTTTANENGEKNTFNGQTSPVNATENAGDQENY
jgi:hypothetical protein